MGIKSLRDRVAEGGENDRYLVKRWCLHTGETGKKFPVVGAAPHLLWVFNEIPYG
ncbi:MAG: hypothetical protein JSW64_10730 [Candidatus Zixiibacteriota bacterium]|nr:MAG: hypothetical protein JSW64_10730 [candidate division Zixibacteria bacterium]